MAEEKDTNIAPGNGSGKGSGMGKDEVALDLMKFIATTAGIGRTGTGAGFGGKQARTPEEQVDVLLQLFERCRGVVGK